MSLIVNFLCPQLRLKFLDAAVQGSDLDLVLLSVAGDVDGGDWLRSKGADLCGEACDLSGQIFDDFFLVDEEASVGDLLLPPDIVRP